MGFNSVFRRVKPFTQTGKQLLCISTAVKHYLPYNDENKL